jgi:hypothetical protein
MGRNIRNPDAERLAAERLFAEELEQIAEHCANLPPRRLPKRGRDPRIRRGRLAALIVIDTPDQLLRVHNIRIKKISRRQVRRTGCMRKPR